MDTPLIEVHGYETFLTIEEGAFTDFDLWRLRRLLSLQTKESGGEGTSLDSHSEDH